MKLPATLQVQRPPLLLAEAATPRGCEPQIFLTSPERTAGLCVRWLCTSPLLGPTCWQSPTLSCGFLNVHSAPLLPGPLHLPILVTNALSQLSMPLLTAGV